MLEDYYIKHTEIHNACFMFPRTQYASSFWENQQILPKGGMSRNDVAYLGNMELVVKMYGSMSTLF